MDGKVRRKAPWRSASKLLVAASLGAAVWTGISAAVAIDFAGASAFLSLSSPISGIISVIALVALVLLVTSICIICCGGATVGRMIKERIMRVDRNAIGVDVTIGDLVVAVHTGKVEVRDVTLANPEPYSSEYLMKAGHVKVDVDMWQFLRTRTRQLTVQSLVFEDVDIIWEKSGLTHSNIKAILEFMEAKRSEKGQQQQQQQQPPQQQRSSSRDVAAAPAHDDAAPGRRIAVKELVVRDVGVKMASHMLAGAGVRLALNDIACADVSSAVKHDMAAEIAREVLYSVLKTIVENTAGKSVGEHLF